MLAAVAAGQCRERPLARRPHLAPDSAVYGAARCVQAPTSSAGSGRCRSSIHEARQATGTSTAASGAAWRLVGAKIRGGYATKARARCRDRVPT